MDNGKDKGKLFIQNVETGKFEELETFGKETLNLINNVEQSDSPQFLMTDGEITLDLKDCYILKWKRKRKGKKYLLYKSGKVNLMQDFFKKVFGVNL